MTANPQPVSRTGRMKDDRLSKQDWLDAGLKLLGQKGPGGLRIDQICKAMKVTKGSFYWHFKDRQDLLTSLFDHWRATRTSALIAEAEARDADPRARMWHVVNHVTLGGYDVGTEVAMRQWGQDDRAVRESLKAVDRERLDFFTRQFEGAGFAPGVARQRAIAVYSYILSCGYMLTGETRDELEARLSAGVDMLLLPTSPGPASQQG